MTGILVRLSAAAVLVGALSAGSAYAQTAEKGAASGGIEEVVVTATRREERLQDVPISVSAFSQEKLDSQGLKNIDDLSRLSPGVTFTRNGTGSNANYNDENSDISIRGIDSTAGSSTTGIYVDDTPVQSRHIGFGAINIFPVLFDIERVEVLRGPQGTLFGAGAEGGAIRFITPSPGLQQFSGYTRAEVATTAYGDPSYEFGAAVGGPLIENVLGFRFSASFRRDGGWVDRVNYSVSDPTALLPTIAYTGTSEKAANWSQTSTFRLALKWKVNDNVSITPSLYYQRLHLNDTSIYWESLSNPGAGVFRDGNALHNPSTDPYYLGAVKLDWNLGFAQLVSNTSYLSRDQSATSDYTQYLRATYALYGIYPNTYPKPGDGGYAPFGDTQRNFYEEIRLASTATDSRIDWHVGLFFSRTNENIPEDIIDPTIEAETGGGVCAVYSVACPNGLIYHGPEDRVVEKQIAAFGELGWKIVDKVKATFGLRVSKIDVDGTTGFGGAFSAVPLSPLITGEAKSSEKPVTPKVVLSYEPDRDNMFYLSAAKGYRAGGVNIPVGVTCDGDLIRFGLPVGADGHPHVPGGFSSDSLWSYEIGAKNTMFGRTLQINSSLFVINWDKIQQQVYLPSCGEQFFANLGKVQSRGGDIDVTWRPIQPLTLDLKLAYTDARYTQASCAGVLAYTGVGLGCGDGTVAPIVAQGDRLPAAPWSFMTSVEYAAPFDALGGRTAYVRADYQRTTAQTALTPGLDYHTNNFDTTSPGLPMTTDLSLRAGMRFSGFDVSLFANNLTNAHPLLFASRDIPADCYTAGYACGDPHQGLAPTDNLYFGRGVRPRTIGLTATYRY